MRETAAGMAATASGSTILRPHLPPTVTEGSRGPGRGQGAVGAAAGSGRAGSKGRIGGPRLRNLSGQEDQTHP